MADSALVQSKRPASRGFTKWTAGLLRTAAGAVQHEDNASSKRVGFNSVRAGMC